MSRLDQLQPLSPVTLVVCDTVIFLNFCRLPDPDLVNELDTTFNVKPGFCFGQGIHVNGKIIPPLYPESEDPLEYQLGFQKAYNPSDVVRVAAEIFQAHGIQPAVEIAPSGKAAISKFTTCPNQTSITGQEAVARIHQLIEQLEGTTDPLGQLIWTALRQLQGFLRTTSL